MSDTFFLINSLFFTPSLPVNYRRRSKKDSPPGGSVWICRGNHKAFADVLGVNIIFAKQVQMLESNTEFDDLETKNLE